MPGAPSCIRGTCSVPSRRWNRTGSIWLRWVIALRLCRFHRLRMRVARTAIVLASVPPALAATGCALGVDSTTAAVGVTSVTAGTPSTPLDDAEITSILRVTYVAAIDESSTATGAADREVARYAMTMSEAYRRALTDEENSIREQGITPRASDESDRISSASRGAMQAFADLPDGPSRDRRFLAREVALQRELLHRIDTELLPSLRVPAVESEILRTRPMIARMLAEAVRLQGWLLTQP
jgi:hypothetical protein